MLIFNPKQADFLFQSGVKILRIIEGKKDGKLAILFDKFDDKFENAMEAWNKLSSKNKI